MPTISLNPWNTIYEEQASLSFDWVEVGTNKFGLRSYAIAEQGGFQNFGFTQCSEVPCYRPLPDGAAEGPHLSQGLFWFKGLPAAAFTAATLRLHFIQISGAAWALKLYGVKERLVHRRAGDAYPATRRQEHRSNYWGRYRRYRCDSTQWEQRHTDAILRFTEPSVSHTTLNLDVLPLVQELAGRTGYDGTMSFVVAPSVRTEDFARPIPTYQPSYDGPMSSPRPITPGWAGAAYWIMKGATPDMLPITDYPLLTLTY